MYIIKNVLLSVVLVVLLSHYNFCQNIKDVEASSKSSGGYLSDEEKQDGWKYLFDGKTPKGWIGVNKESFPNHGWEIKKGVLTVLASSDKSDRGGDILTVSTYSDFELSLEFKVWKGGNSGIKYLTQESPMKALEYQILDDKNHPDAQKGRDGNRTMGALYDLIAPTEKKVNPLGEWNHARISVKGCHIEHWLNGSKILEFCRGSEEFNRLVSISKYKNLESFGKISKGHILLQDHGDKVSFRNIKIREYK